jgi:hypothetical protein
VGKWRKSKSPAGILTMDKNHKYTEILNIFASSGVHRVQRQKIGNTVKEALLKKMNLYGE